MSDAMIGYGSVFQIVSENSPDLYVALAEVTNITPPNFTLDQIDVSHMQSPGKVREFIPGLIDPGECSFEMNFVPSSTSDDRLLELLALPVGTNQNRSCRISYPNGVTDTFLASLVGYERTMPTDDKMSATVTFKVSGSITRGAT